MTFDVCGITQCAVRNDLVFETFVVCRRCGNSTVFVLQLKRHDQNYPSLDALTRSEGCLNDIMKSNGYISQKDMNARKPPDYLPDEINVAFKEAATCVAVSCFNAAGSMLRLCCDIATRSLLPSEGEPPNTHTRERLGLRIRWLFESAKLPSDLFALAECVTKDGNDGVHIGTLTKVDADDLMDFTEMLLERLYTEPRRVELAAERRAARRQES